MSANGIRVGMVVPTLGTRSAWLRECVASIEDQGSQVEMCIVTPPDAVARVRSEFPGRTVVGEPERGLIAAIERGWKELEGCEPVSWLGDDDVLTSGSVARALASLRAHPDAAMVFGDVDWIDADGRRLVTVRPGSAAPRWLTVGQNFIAQPGCLYRRAAVEAIGGLPRAFPRAFDAVLHLELQRRTVYCPSVLAKARVHDSRITSAEGDASAMELERAVIEYQRRDPRLRVLGGSRRFWRLAGRVRYRMIRTY